MRAILAATLLAAATPALAAPVAYEFRVDIATGPLAGESFRGSFAIDDSLLALGDGDAFNAAGLGIPALDVAYGADSFTPANADAVFLAVSGGKLVDFIIGGAASGLDLVDAGDSAADFLLDANGFAYKLAGADQFIFDGVLVRFQRVPAPAALALFGLGLGALALRRR